MDYSKRLADWNASERYRTELAFLDGLIDVQVGHAVLDYGCGIGTAMKFLSEKYPKSRVYGYDVERYRGAVMPNFLIRDSYYFKFDRVFLMHSLAHIPNPIKALIQIREKYLFDTGTITVITPNADWLQLKNNGQPIKTDNTVIEHFTSSTLIYLFNVAGFEILDVGQFGDKISNQSERLYLVAKKRL
jgi:2-polyprenyl-3-methyl-5-hydroxy-6-metoxy-1,4-benzoquinol methylase